MLVVNSFPRTANRFFINYINQHFGDQGIKYTPETMHSIDMLYNSKIDQVVILRKPEDCIPSYFILSYKPGSPFTIEAAIKHWIRWNEVMVENINHLYPFTFEKICSSPLIILETLENLLGMTGDIDKTKNFFEKYEKDGHSIPKDVKESSKLSKHYQDVVDMYYAADAELLNKAQESYAFTLNAIRSRQASYQ